ncbi:MAG: hypothetical protein K0R50_2182 [Eubacterium sp.]|nr:hypothetical protein [Eubacterium sp.]
MRTSIKIKFSIFLAVLLLLTVFVLSLLVLQGIKKDQQVQYEQYLTRQAKTANVYFIQTILAEATKVPKTFLTSKGKEFAEQLELISGQSVVLYDRDGTVVSKKVSLTESDSIKRTLEFARNNKTAYLVEKDSLYYFAPLRSGNEQVGVVQFNYSLSGHHEFYNHIRQLFIYIGAGVFFLSFILAYFYFDSFANGIIRLEQTVGRIREGHYETAVLTRRDEIGRLSEGINAMSGQINKTISDMEEEKKKLTLAVNKLSLLDRQQKQFIGNVTHEFKTPLTSIKAYIDLLEMYPDDENLLETARTNIKSETQRLYEMVEKVLQLSALEKYDFEYKKERIELKQTILSVLNSLKGKLDKFGISLQTELTEAFVEADKDSMTIVLMNLLDNAIKYNKAEGSISVKNYLEKDRAVIEIADTGIGIPEELAGKIFDPFYTVDKNRSRQSGGVGLGLSLAQKHADTIGGSVTLVNTNTDGTTFRIVFPLHV